MKLNCCTAAVSLINLANVVQFVNNCREGILTVSIAASHPPARLHLRTYDRNTVANHRHLCRQLRDRRQENNDNRKISRQEQSLTSQPPPVKIVRQDELPIEFVLRNITWFASKSSSASFDVMNTPALYVHAKLSLDMFESEHAYVPFDNEDSSKLTVPTCCLNQYSI